MKKNILGLLLLIGIKLLPLTCVSQTPFDGFANYDKKKPILELSEFPQVFTIVNLDTNSDVLFMSFDKENGFVSYFSKHDTLLYFTKINERDSKWLSIDPLASKYPNLSPYNFVANSPIMFIDPDGRDIRYFDCSGHEVVSKRVTSDQVFKTFVQTGYSVMQGGQSKAALYSEVQMPTRITNYSPFEISQNRDYNKYDYDIAAQTAIFNMDKREGSNQLDKGNGGDPSNVPNLNPNTVKAMILKETNYGYVTSHNGGVDIMQTNVTGDWSDSKSRLGLTKGSTANYQQSISAGITWLYWKGVTIQPVKDAKGKTTGYNASWTGGTDWSEAVKKYNGGGDANYMQKFTQIMQALKSNASVDATKKP